MLDSIAINEYREALRLDHENAWAHRSLGEALRAKGELQGGQEEARIAEKLAPGLTSLKRLRLGGQVMAARLMHHPLPEYPPDAKAAGTQGKVQIEALIGKDGGVKDLRVVSGDRTLASAAIATILKWIYKPVLLNGEAVEVLTEIDINFFR